MAEFRKLFYALGLASLLVGGSSTALAAVDCDAQAANVPIIREESFTELTGDIVIRCTGGPSTPAGVPVPTVTITLNVSTVITSRIVDGNPAIDAVNGLFTEAVLIIDEPNSSSRPTIPLKACGDGNAPTHPFRSTNEPGVCEILGAADPKLTYDGTANRANVFQGRLTPSINGQVGQELVFYNVPLDPPGADDSGPLTRTLRITNIRVLPPGAAAQGDFLTPVNIELNVNGTGVTLNNNGAEHNLLRVASVQKSLENIPVVESVKEYLQCEALTDNVLSPILFREMFASAFKVRNWGEIETNGFVSGGAWVLKGLYSSGNFNSANQTLAYTAGPNRRQNVPGGIYFTEGGFSGARNDTPNDAINQTVPSPTNPPDTVGTVKTTTNGNPTTNTNNSTIASSGGSPTGTSSTGQATNGTRFIINVSAIPEGSSVVAPQYAYLYRAGTGTSTTRIATGVARRIAPGSRGDDPTSVTVPGVPVAALATGPLVTSSTGTATALYEVIFSRHEIREEIVIELGVQINGGITSGNAATNFNPALVTGGLAPFALSSDNFAQAYRASSVTSATLTANGNAPIPRFRQDAPSPAPLYKISKCACNLLFPFVSSQNANNGNFDTGIAIANTSLLPPAASNGNPVTGFLQGTSQKGPVEFFYFHSIRVAPNAETAIGSQCTNSTKAGDCPGNLDVQAGETLTYVLTQGSTRWGLDNRAANFRGYIIAQARFKYCHGFAYISPEGAEPLTNGMSVGYLALVLDEDDGVARTTARNEVLGN